MPVGATGDAGLLMRMLEGGSFVGITTKHGQFVYMRDRSQSLELLVSENSHVGWGPDADPEAVYELAKAMYYYVVEDPERKSAPIIASLTMQCMEHGEDWKDYDSISAKIKRMVNHGMADRFKAARALNEMRISELAEEIIGAIESERWEVSLIALKKWVLTLDASDMTFDPVPFEESVEEEVPFRILEKVTLPTGPAIGDDAPEYEVLQISEDAIAYLYPMGREAPALLYPFEGNIVARISQTQTKSTKISLVRYAFRGDPQRMDFGQCEQLEGVKIMGIWTAEGVASCFMSEQDRDSLMLFLKTALIPKAKKGETELV